MRRCRRNLSVLVLVTCGVCTFLCSLSVFLLPHEQDPEEAEGRLQNQNQNLHRRIETRNVIMNGQREILNINSHPPAIVATISSSSKAPVFFRNFCRCTLLWVVGCCSLYVYTCTQLLARLILTRTIAALWTYSCKFKTHCGLSVD